MRRTAPRSHDDALRALRARRELALGRFTVDEELARRLQMVGGARTVGALLLAHDEEQIHSPFARLGKAFGGTQHRRGDALGITGAATIEPRLLETGADVRRDRIEVRRQRDTTSRSRRPHVGATLGDLLQGDVPAARDQPAGNEIDRRAFSAGGGLECEKLGSERDNVGHSAKLAGGESGCHRRPRKILRARADAATQ